MHSKVVATKNTRQLFGLIIYLLSELKHAKLVSVVSRYQLLQTDGGCEHWHDGFLVAVMSYKYPVAKEDL